MIRIVSISLFVRIIGAISAFVFNVFIARILPIQYAGIFFLCFSIILILWNIASLGMPMAILRFISSSYSKNDWDSIQNLLVLAFIRVTIISCLICVLVFTFVEYLFMLFSIDPVFVDIMKILIFTVPMIALNNLIGFALQAVHRPILSVTLKNILISALSCLGMSIIILFDFSINNNTIAYIFLCSVILVFFIGLILWTKITGGFTKQFRIREKEFIEASKSFYAINLMGILVQWSGIFILGSFVNETEVALYSIALRTSMLMSFVLIAVNLVVAPQFAANFTQGNIEEIKKTAKLSSRILLLCATPILLIMISYPEFILSFFGEDYKQAAILLQILVVGQFVNVGTGSVTYLLNMTGHEKDMKMLVFISGTVALLLGIVLSYTYGAVGAAVATSIAISSQNLMAVLKVKIRLGFNLLNIT
ncbi:MAG: oligosaccharide flippase family protein [Candidatus Gracilibacteria bacterium]|nr:oligosaccharide flippase family protein [Candidatus Gracilibacteria bacterium]